MRKFTLSTATKQMLVCLSIAAIGLMLVFASMHHTSDDSFDATSSTQDALTAQTDLGSAMDIPENGTLGILAIGLLLCGGREIRLFRPEAELALAPAGRSQNRIGAAHTL